MNEAHHHLAEVLRNALIRVGVATPNVILEKPRNPEHGDIATNVAMVYAKELRLAPRALADKILEFTHLDNHFVSFASIAGPGFMNFTLMPDYLQGVAATALGNEDSFGDRDDLAGKRIHIEFVSANPSGPLNIVSARAAAVGDSLARMFRARGAACDTEFYVNDAGNQVRLLGESVLARYEAALGHPASIPEGGYHGEYLVEFANRLVEEHGNRFHGADVVEAARTLGRLAVGHHVALQREMLRSFRVDFQRWFFESELRTREAEFAILKELRKRDAVYEKDGAVFLRTSDFGDSQDWVVVTSDGRPTYFLPDIAYHCDKLDRGYDLVINILGPDHHSFPAKMRAALRALGRNADRLEVVILQHVTLLRNGEPVKMSKRAGRLIEMDELVDEVGVDASRYFFLLRKAATPLEFDIELAKKQSDENPVYYVQYAHARIESIFRKAGVCYPLACADLSLLIAPEELNLLRRIREIGDVLSETTETRDPHAITVWLREVAAHFHRFYHQCRVITTPVELQAARLSLCRATQIALARGLHLCGVEAPKEM